MAETNPVTGLPNGTAGRCRLEQVVRQGSAGALLVVDVDGFKKINDHHGLDVGDAVLRELADALRQALPKGAYLAQLGGDEFLVLLQPPCTLQDAVRQAEAVRVAVADTPFTEAALRLTLSLGVAVPPSGSDWSARDWLDLVYDRSTAAKKDAQGWHGNRVYANALPFHWGEHRMRFLGWPAICVDP